MSPGHPADESIGNPDDDGPIHGEADRTGAAELIGEGPIWTDDRIAALAGWSLIRASLAFQPSFGQALAPAGLSPTQFGILVQVDNMPGIAQAALARRCMMTPQSMGEILPALESAGWVARTPRRGRGQPIPVRLTPAGRELLARVTPAVEEVNGAAALGLDDAERRRLNELLHKVAAAHGAPTP